MFFVSFQRYVGLTDQEGSNNDRRIRCKFSRERYIPGDKKLVNLDDDHYILLAKGKVNRNGMASNKSIQRNKMYSVFTTEKRWPKANITDINIWIP